MATVKMRKLSLFVLKEQKEELLFELMLLGCVDFTEPDYILRNPEATGLVRREPGNLEARLADYRALSKGLEIISKHFPSKRVKPSQRPKITQKELFDEKDLTACIERAKSLAVLDAKLHFLGDEEIREKYIIESLEPWSSLTLPLDSGGTERASAIIGTVSATIDTGTLEKALSAAVSEASCSVISSDSARHYLSIICLREKEDNVLDVLRPFGFAVSPLKKFNGTASENIKRISSQIAEMQKVKWQILTQIEEQMKFEDALRRCYDLTGTQVARAEAAEKLLATGSSFYATGWMPATSESSLSALLAKYTCAWELTDPPEDELEAVPVISKRGTANQIFSPLRVTTTYVDFSAKS